MKKVLMLGGNYYQMTATKKAKELGYYVISCDYLPENPAHKYADEYHNISTTEKGKILSLAQQLNIDGIVSYASDISAPTAAYVAEEMGLPTNPYESVLTMARKDLFRKSLKELGFNTPKSECFTDIGEASDFFSSLKKPVMIKPVDASGTKGITKISNQEEFQGAYELAMNSSIAKIIVLEEFIERSGYQIAGDAFVIDGKIEFFGVANEHFDKLCNPLVPIGESFPSIEKGSQLAIAKSEIERYLKLLNYKNGAINLDFMFDREGNLYILELGPRNGGNLITDAIILGGGADLAKYTIQNAVGDLAKCEFPYVDSYVSSYVIHTRENGVFSHITVNPELQDCVIRSDLFVKPGDEILRFNNGGCGIGAMLLKFDSSDMMLDAIDNMENYMTVHIK